MLHYAVVEAIVHDEGYLTPGAGMPSWILSHSSQQATCGWYDIYGNSRRFQQAHTTVLKNSSSRAANGGTATHSRIFIVDGARLLCCGTEHPTIERQLPRVVRALVLSLSAVALTALAP